MASILRQIVAGPRARHPEAGLDLCYVTDDIIATSGPSQTYPQRAYRNPLDQLVSFLDAKHGDGWAIWEFRAEGTGYPDEAVYGRIRHYPWPDHHPPPFRLVPMIMAGMRNWLHGGPLEGAAEGPAGASPDGNGSQGDGDSKIVNNEEAKTAPGKRVVVVHCKAGKGRSGTAACSYLISEQGWTVEAALARFTERRMRPRFGAGVSIPSQLRWISYVDRWTRHGKRYVDGPVEIVEVHVWGLRNGVKVDVEGFVDNGRAIRVFHTFSKKERVVVEGDPPAAGGLGSMLWEWAGYQATAADKTPPTSTDQPGSPDSTGSSGAPPDRPGSAPLGEKKHRTKMKRKGTDLMLKVSPGLERRKSRTTPAAVESDASAAASATDVRTEAPDAAEPGGMAVIFKPHEPVRVPTADINVSVERRNRTSKSMGLTMVTAVAHVWFNAFFEGQGPEQGGRASESGVFTIDWDAMDGIKGSSRKGARALDRIAVVWRIAGRDDSGADDAITRSAEGGDTATGGANLSDAPHVTGGEEIIEPPEGQPVPQLPAADWASDEQRGRGRSVVVAEPDLGLRVQSPASADVSRASSLRSAEGVVGGKLVAGSGQDDDGASLEGVRCSGPMGEELVDDGRERRGT